ncbi:sigma-70 family RNA polymerase sigma factor [Celeribacter neptunius]|nr:sigma-70 family RNA polymerase sigma factor [Celeribacter neptunius]
MPDRIDIENWISRIALGDRAAFSALYDATSAKLFGTCLRVLKDRAEAEDVLQEVYIRIWRGAGRYRSNGLSPMTWLITIARNRAIDRLRARQSGVRRGAEGGAGEDGVLERMASPDPGPEAQVAAKGEARAIALCLDELEADRAAAVRGAYLDGQTYAELAERFDVPMNTMRTWLRRSLMKLKDCLSQ